jgi:radical SAM enzyme (TIGR01210 family)
MSTGTIFPAAPAARDRFVIARRGPRSVHHPWRHQGVTLEDERTADGRIARSATVFLTGRECPWRCVMCDLWTFTTETDTPPGALVAQLNAALADIDAREPAAPRPEVIKLYNAGSFFDPRAVPEVDYAPLATTLRGLARVVVESHPSLVGGRLLRFREALERAAPPGTVPRMEVAMGLETSHPDALEQLHKRFTLDQFARAAARVQAAGADLRVFLLVGVPFIRPAEQHEWVCRSVRAAFDCGAAVVSLIPTRRGNGTLEALEAAGLFVAPTIHDMETTFDAALAVACQREGRRVFADLWDLDRCATCPACLAARRARLHAMNLTQQVLPPVTCMACQAGAVPA